MTENECLVSVIIPVYNGDRHLAEAIESVLAQTYRPIEIIVVDDGSTDNTANIARSYQQVRYIYQKNQGNGTAKNTGISVAQGELIAFLDVDDLWTSNKLNLQVNYLLQYPHIDATICQMRNILESGNDWPSWLKKEHIDADVAGYIPSALVVRKTVFEKIGNFDPTYRRTNDADWFFRAKDGGIVIAVIPEVLLYKRIHNSNLSHQTKEMNSELMGILRSSIERKRNQKLSNPE